jgi:hypothetical protein
MLVACISYYDQSIPHAANILLQNNCLDFFRKVGDALPNLLKPAEATSQTSGGSRPGTARANQAPRSNPAAVNAVVVKDLQQVLMQDGDYPGPINGVYSSETMAAYEKYLAKHPNGPEQGQAPAKPAQ